MWARRLTTFPYPCRLFAKSEGRRTESHLVEVVASWQPCRALSGAEQSFLLGLTRSNDLCGQAFRRLTRICENHPAEGEIDAKTARLLGFGDLMFPLSLHSRLHDEQTARSKFNCLDGTPAFADLEPAS